MKHRNFKTFPLSGRRGQVALLWALLIPILFLCLGLGLDLGWYYLNVLRLQNAADSAAVAGAQKILENKKDTELSDYNSAKLVSYYIDNPYIPVDDKLIKTIGESHDEAANYAWKNLSASKDSFQVHGDGNYTMIDGWSKKNNSKVTMNSSMYQDGDKIYFVVKLNEDIRHFLMPGWFNSMSAPVTAVAMLSKKVLSNSKVLDANINNDNQRINESPSEIIPDLDDDNNSSASGGSSNSAKDKTLPPVNSSDSALNKLIDKIFGENITTIITSNSTNQDNSNPTTPPDNSNPTRSGTSTIGNKATKTSGNSKTFDSSTTQQKPPSDKTTTPNSSDKSTVAGVSISDSGNQSSSRDSDTQQPLAPPLNNTTTPTKPGNSAVGGVTTTATETRTPNGSNSSGSSGGSNVRTPTTPASGNTQLAISPTDPNGTTILPPAQNTNSVTPIQPSSSTSPANNSQTPPPAPKTVIPILPQSGTTITIPSTAVNPYPAVIPPVLTLPAINTLTPYVPIKIDTPTTPVTPSSIPSDVSTTPTPTRPDQLPTPVKPEGKLQLIFDTNVSQFGGKDKRYEKKISTVEILREKNQKVTAQISPTPSLTNHEFIGWNTKRDGTGKYIADGQKLTPSQVESLFGSKKVATLYAQWDDIINNKTLWEQMEYIKAKHVYDPDWTTSIHKYGSSLNVIDVSLDLSVKKHTNIETESRIGGINTILRNTHVAKI